MKIKVQPKLIETRTSVNDGLKNILYHDVAIGNDDLNFS